MKRRIIDCWRRLLAQVRVVRLLMLLVGRVIGRWWIGRMSVLLLLRLRRMPMRHRGGRTGVSAPGSIEGEIASPRWICRFICYICIDGGSAIGAVEWVRRRLIGGMVHARLARGLRMQASRCKVRV